MIVAEKGFLLHLWHVFRGEWHGFLWVRCSLMSGVPDFYLPLCRTCSRYSVGRPIFAMCFRKLQCPVRNHVWKRSLFLLRSSMNFAFCLLKFRMNNLEYRKPRRLSRRDTLSCSFLSVSSFLWVFMPTEWLRFDKLSCRGRLCQ